MSGLETVEVMLSELEFSGRIDVQYSFELRRQSEQLLDAAKRAVEIAIEDSEEAAIKWLDTMKTGVEND